MNPLVDFLNGWIRSAALGLVFWAFSLGLFVYVMGRNFQRLKREDPPLELDEGESEVARIDVRFPALRTRTVVTSRRIVQARHSWFLSKRKIKGISLDDVHSIVWRRYVNWFLLLVAAYFLNSINPLALLLLLFGLQSKVYCIRFATPFAQMPYTRVVITTTDRRQLVPMRRFFEAAQNRWARMIVEKRSAASEGAESLSFGRVPHLSSGDVGEDDFAWGAVLLFYVCVLEVLALMQRIHGPHVMFDDYLFGPLYVGLVAAAAAGLRRDGLWLAVLGLVAVLTIKFPGSGILSLAADGGSPLFEEYAVVLIVLLAIGASSSLLAAVHPLLSCLAVWLWLVVPAATGAGVASETSLVTKVLLATGWAALLRAADDALRLRASVRSESPSISVSG